MRTCMIAVGNILFLFHYSIIPLFHYSIIPLFHYSFLNVLSSFLHAVNKVIPAAFIVG
ncbi:TPA: succinate dehydrogenase [Klebsiella quasipneumoniae]|nr:succinate dehydrogenase [Klebsiella quasipneumoniae]HBT6023727.1 succinate dehydrogenase [Klebsiella quasipneumoniae]